MHSNRRYKICNCSVILGERQSFRNDKGLSIIFRKIFDEIQTYYEIETFSDSSRLSSSFLHPKILGSLFFYEK